MKSQKEIGSSIKEKLGENRATLENPVWDRIQDTLQKEKRRKLLFSWSLNGLIILVTIGGFILLTTTSSEEKKVSVDANTRSKIQKTETANQNKNEVLAPSPEKKDKQASEKLQPTIAANRTTKLAIPKKIEAPKESPSTFKTKAIKKEISKPQVQETPVNILEETSATRTETMYYYYNSKDGQEVTSKNKKVIDSTVQANSIKKDSLQ